jgi:phospholipid/cholesterol/gamma-HCH transport system substrate-binding protein
MAKKTINNIKLGLFVLAGMLFLITLLYLIGKNRNLFGSNFILKTQFEHIQGLKAGNNVRYAGIDVGTVKRITIINDTLVEVAMVMEDRMRTIIRRNAVATIGTDGLVGNKVVNIAAAKEPGPVALQGDILPSRKPMDTDDMLRTLNRTNNDVAIIAENLKTTVTRVNNSQALWNLLNETALPQNLQAAAQNIRKATANANEMVNDVQLMVRNIKNGEGSAGALLTDTTFAHNLNAAVLKINQVGVAADSLSRQLNSLVTNIEQEMNSGKGALHLLLKDSTLSIKLNRSLDNIQQGTDGFNQNMEALKHNFLLRGYFRKLEKKQLILNKKTAPAD